jgi:hypothetical protein
MSKNDQPRDGKGNFLRTTATAEREARAAELRAKGMHYRDIARELGIDVHQAHDDVRNALRAIVQEPAEELRTLELERLDRMYQAAADVLERQHVAVSHGKIVYQGEEPLIDDGPVLQAIDRLLKIQARRAALLGLDAATKTEVSGGVRYEIVGIDAADLT